MFYLALGGVLDLELVNYSKQTFLTIVFFHSCMYVVFLVVLLHFDCNAVFLCAL